MSVSQLVLACLYFFFVVVFLYYSFHSTIHSNVPLSKMLSLVQKQQEFYVQSAVGDRHNYLRVNITNILYDEPFSRVQGSQFKLRVQGSCFGLTDYLGNWVHNVNSKLTVVGEEDDVLLFQLVNVVELRENSFKSMFQICGKQQYVDLEDNTLLSNSNGTWFTLEAVTKMKGVNLGGWFIPEVWMNPSFYEGTGLGWGGSLCAMVALNRSLTEQRIRSHLQSWITESDFAQIAASGFNGIRLPIGYWNVIDDVSGLYAPRNVSFSLQLIDWVFTMAEKYDISVMIDLHGAPGSQNGQDHSGCGYSILGAPQWTKDVNIQQTLEALEAIALRYSSSPKLFAIELLNEPAQSIEEMDHFLLLHFYEQAYAKIRQINEGVLIVFNELYQHCYSWWDSSLLEPMFYNVAVDWHLYDGMGPQAEETRIQHLADAAGYGKLIDEYKQFHPVIVGEWSMSTGSSIGDQSFVDVCEQSFQKGMGWYLWNWKLERGIGYDLWDVQYQISLSRGGLSPINN